MIILRFLIALGLGYFLYLRFFRQEDGESKELTFVKSGGANEGRRLNWIICSRGPLSGKAFFVGSKTITVGRSPNNFIQIVDDSVSRIHCQLTPVEGGLRLIDMKSQNGVLVNGRPVSDVVLKHRSVFRISGSVFTYLKAGDFATDAGLGGKFGGRDADDDTRLVSKGELSKLIEEELKEANGDIQAAAANLGVELEFLESVISETKSLKE